MLPPKDVYSAVIHNHTGKEVTVHLTYTNSMVNKLIRHTLVIPPGGQAAAEQRTFKEGATEFTTVITSVQVEGVTTKLMAPFPHVDSPTKDYPINIVEKNGAIEVQGKSV
ncbi:hypothetical protein ABB37_03006 [Leptomonas pyrrhocoris]|uniref:Uncharacterized protein n=1 Tax=Leptomonas pyrrhocoris TaxID=157538 RepID=A0A0M9G6M2_LEPPY|nr:hypothetical protein ABB37_03006 [Leptomonas pyrrhocoris]XP_015661795.1 hypothetical protein ABB37_03006 [Leptomonas pyrrhocoris]KPA83355.1 hypothetical protein ABB37_03006 [Leptomonas pyrrhocoris]KPA83356.1 hypothetical protein ABB37_03006 [Leptomonas pyrrhocoris]|eukprot:XP_015661794.1 hypothetical protein ABB37_03006 [Leptomonas pyrrhocoris]